MTTQIEFEKTIHLLEQNRNAFPEIGSLLDLYINSEVTFLNFDNISPGNTKLRILRIYEIRSKIEEDRKDNQHVIGYDKLIPKLRAASYKHICISSFGTRNGTFVVFSDFAKIDLIGVLISKTTLQNTREKMEEHRKMVEAYWGEVDYDYTKNQKVFINGRLHTT